MSVTLPEGLASIKSFPLPRSRADAGRRVPGDGSPARGPSPEQRCQATVQEAPLRVNAVGLAALPVCVAWKPMVIEPLTGMAAL